MARGASGGPSPVRAHARDVSPSSRLSSGANCQAAGARGQGAPGPGAHPGAMARRRDIATARRTTPRGDFDVVVIGSGIGGLMAAALLARLQGKRVLVLERHDRAGGFTHTFDRPGGLSWDVGVHYVGAEVVTPGVPRDAFRVATGGALAWTRMPDPFERLVFPGF